MGTNETRDGQATAPATTDASPTDALPATPPASPRRRRGPDRRSADGAVSDRRGAANRANAARSTGPRTARGKRITRFNALRHGLAAQTPILPGESEVALAALTAEFEADHGDGTAAERAVAGRMVSVVWRLRRLARAEEHVANKLQTRHAYAWGARRARLGIPPPEAGHEFDGPDPMPGPSNAPQILAEDLARGSGEPGELERLMLWDVRLGAELMAAGRQLANLRRALGPGREAEPDPDLGLDDDGDEEDDEEEEDEEEDGEGDEDEGDVGGDGGEQTIEPMIEPDGRAASSPLPPGEVAAPRRVRASVELLPSVDGPARAKSLGEPEGGSAASPNEHHANLRSPSPAAERRPLPGGEVEMPPVPTIGIVPPVPTTGIAPTASDAAAAAPDRTHCSGRRGPTLHLDRARGGW